LRCTWTAAEIGLDLPLVMLPFPPRARAKHYFDITPLGTVPALVDGDATLTESSAIAHYLAVKYSPGDLAVMPDEPDYGAFLDYLHHADATLTFPQTVRMRFVLFEPARNLQDAGEAYGDWFAKRLAKVDQRLATREWLCAGRFTVADICIAYALYLTRVSRLSHHLTPRLAEWLEGVTARPAFQRAVAREAAEAVAQGAR
jgi:glutathione S-transferase